VEIDGRRNSKQSADKIATFAKALVPFAHRWEDLRFHHIGPTAKTKQAYENFKSLDLPRLERLAIWSEKWEAADDIYSTWTMPKLRRVIFNNGVPAKLPGKSNILECDLVIENDVLKNYFPKLAETLGSFISLTTLRLKFKDASLPGAYEQEMGPLHLPNLRTFHADMHFREYYDFDSTGDTDNSDGSHTPSDTGSVPFHRSTGRTSNGAIARDCEA
jgi:hypothetical protein